jgi:hypothetical protein
MASATTTFGTQTAFGSVANLNSLTSAAACAIGAVDTSATGALAFEIDFSITLAASAVSSTGVLTFYLIQSMTSTSSGFSDGISPTGTSVASSIKNATIIRTYNANANSQVVADTFYLPVPAPAKYWSLVVSNGSGATLASSGHSFNYTPITETIA